MVTVEITQLRRQPVSGEVKAGEEMLITERGKPGVRILEEREERC